MIIVCGQLIIIITFQRDMYESDYREKCEEYNTLKRELDAKYQGKKHTFEETIQVLKSKVEGISRERDDWKYDAQERKKAKGDKSKELTKLKAQVV